MSVRTTRIATRVAQSSWQRLGRIVVFASIATCGVFANANDSTASHIVVQTSFVAGFGSYDGKRLYKLMRVGDSLSLIREHDNAGDANAVRVEWQGKTIGYVPADENEALARQFDFGNRFYGRITRLSRHRDPDRRVEFEIFAVL